MGDLVEILKAAASSGDHNVRLQANEKLEEAVRDQYTGILGALCTFTFDISSFYLERSGVLHSLSLCVYRNLDDILPFITNLFDVPGLCVHISSPGTPYLQALNLQVKTSL